MENTESICLNVSEIAREMRISKTSAYKLVKEPSFPKVSVGKRIITTRKALNEYLEGLINQCK